MSGANYLAAHAIRLPANATPSVFPDVENRLMGTARARDNAANERAAESTQSESCGTDSVDDPSAGNRLVSTICD